MSTFILPSIGLTGKFELARELAGHYKPEVAYTVKSARRLDDIIRAGEDVFADYYEPLGYTRDRVTSDSEINACIIGMVTSTQQWLYVPNTAILAMPDESGVPYTDMGVGIELGPVHDSYDLEPLKAQLKATVMDYLGVAVNVTEMAIGEKIFLSDTDHNATLRERQLKKTRNATDTSIIEEQRILIAELRAKNTQLEKYIYANKDKLGI